MQVQGTLSKREKVDWIRLIRSENVGPITFYGLLSRYKSVEAALEALPELARRGGRNKPIEIPSREAAEREVASVEALGGQVLCRDEIGYPALLREVEDAPPVIFIRGRSDLLASRMIGVVGARNASAIGRRFARQISQELGQVGMVIVSGLARGIDTSAHEGALATGTIAVMAGGIDVVYPEENRALYDDITDRGVAVTEMPPGTVPQGRHFPRRNRIISGLSLGVVVVEAAERSGSLITARFAGEQGREVFAVPGSPLDPRCKGTNGLIREGAHLTETAADILDVLNSFRISGLAEAELENGAHTGNKPIESDVSAARRAVVEALGPTPAPVDEIIRQCHLSPGVVSMILLELELAGRIERHAGHRVSLLS